MLGMVRKNDEISYISTKNSQSSLFVDKSRMFHLFWMLKRSTIYLNTLWLYCFNVTVFLKRNTDVCKWILSRHGAWPCDHFRRNKKYTYFNNKYSQLGCLYIISLRFYIYITLKMWYFYQTITVIVTKKKYRRNNLLERT